MNPKTDFYFSKEKWQQELAQLRSVALDCELTEKLKWGCPCYTFEGRNIVLIHVFKEYCAYLLFKGTLLKDTDGILVQQTDNVQEARQIRFTNVQEIKKLKPVLKTYIYEAIEVEKAGLKVPLKKTAEYDVPEELQTKLNKDSVFKTAFESLTPGRKRGYILYFSGAKQAKTRIDRIEKCIPQILEGKALND